MRKPLKPAHMFPTQQPGKLFNKFLTVKSSKQSEMPQKTRFEGVSFDDIPVVEMDPDILYLCRGFKCKRPEFQSYIGGSLIKTESESMLSKCFIVHHGGHLAG